MADRPHSKRPTLECHQWVRELVGARKNGQHQLLLFDFDGTLAPICSHPEKSRIPYRTSMVLKLLSTIPNLSLGVISGRPLNQLETLFTHPAKVLSGSGGRQIRLGNETITDPNLKKDEKRIKELGNQLRNLCLRFPGTWVECKPGCLTLHYRALKKGAQSHLKDLVSGEFHTRPQQWNILDVSKSLEFTTVNSWDKSTAVKLARRALPPDLIVFYAGDSDNDVKAIDLVNHFKGVTIGLGKGSPENARFFEPTTGSLTMGLERLALEILVLEPFMGLSSKIAS